LVWKKENYEENQCGQIARRKIRGGCSPLGMKKPYPIYIHESCLMLDHIFISAGQRGLQLRLNPEDLIKITGAVIGDMVE
jgi:Cys-tRNA(Pro)/Cys-tRNA(Cys) deacylase